MIGRRASEGGDEASDAPFASQWDGGVRGGGWVACYSIETARSRAGERSG
jgi:hypothetical protein